MLIQTLFLEHIMNLRAKIMASLVVLAFLGGCTEH
ncbi:MAG: hypothetical protein RIS10_1062, partial [Pseudomonadota bacterium]